MNVVNESRSRQIPHLSFCLSPRRVEAGICVEVTLGVDSLTVYRG